MGRFSRKIRRRFPSDGKFADKSAKKSARKFRGFEKGLAGGGWRLTGPKIQPQNPPWKHAPSSRRDRCVADLCHLSVLLWMFSRNQTSSFRQNSQQNPPNKFALTLCTVSGPAFSLSFFISLFSFKLSFTFCFSVFSFFLSLSFAFSFFLFLSLSFSFSLFLSLSLSFSFSIFVFLYSVHTLCLPVLSSVVSA